ncbi:dipeptidase [Streptomyces sp. CA2R106]|uniref:dipeptidase n=1 Tax=Streptomyces sp. CA2R106 TaxID=3120153 RepID=UPI003007F2E4
MSSDPKSEAPQPSEPQAEPSGPLAGTVASLMPRARTELAELVSFASVADERQYPRSELRKAADWIAAALTADGFEDVALLDTPDGTQSVYGLLPGPAGAPTVLLYAHYDVQPPLDEAQWLSPPFELTERDGRWYGRGAADCKGGLLMHLTALRALRAHGGVPVNVKVIVEGSEEQGTGGLERYAEAHPELLTADAIVIGDTGNFRVGLPTVTASLRGMAMAEVRVSTLAGNLHSGQFGGAAPDALAALIQMLASLRDASGATTVDGLDNTGEWTGLAYEEADFRKDAKVLDGVGLVGGGAIADRLWARPAVTVLGIDAPPVVGATPSVQAEAGALVSVRVPPGTDAAEAAEALENHLRAAAPWGAKVRVERRGSGQPFAADTASPAYASMSAAMREAYGQEMAIAGQGGSIPLCNTLATLYPSAEILLIGLSEPDAQIHAVNESVSPQELERLALTEALFLRRYAAARAN